MTNKKLKQQLKSESKTFVPDVKNEIFSKLAINTKAQEQVFRFNNKHKLSLVFTAFLAIFILVGIVILYNPTPIEASNSIITISINPAIEIEIDKDDNIIDVRALNVDGALVIEELGILDYVNTSYTEVVTNIIDTSTKLGYIDPLNADATINLSTANNSQNKEDTVKTNIKTELSKHLDKINLHIRINDEIDNDDIKNDAKNHKKSVGFMNLVYKAMAADEDLSLKTALELTPRQLNEIINHYNKTKINVFKENYKKVQEDLKEYQKQKRNEIEKAIEDMIDFIDIYLDDHLDILLEQIEDMIDDNESSLLIEAILWPLVNTLIDDYDWSPEEYDDIYEFYEEVLEDIEDYLDQRVESLKDAIEDFYDQQEKDFNNYIRQMIDENNYNFNYKFQMINLEDIIGDWINIGN